MARFLAVWWLLALPWKPIQAGPAALLRAAELNSPHISAHIWNSEARIAVAKLA